MNNTIPIEAIVAICTMSPGMTSTIGVISLALALYLFYRFNQETQHEPPALLWDLPYIDLGEEEDHE